MNEHMRMLNHLRKAANEMEKTKPKHLRVHHEKFSRKMRRDMDWALF